MSLALLGFLGIARAPSSHRYVERKRLDGTRRLVVYNYIKSSSLPFFSSLEIFFLNIIQRDLVVNSTPESLGSKSRLNIFNWLRMYTTQSSLYSTWVGCTNPTKCCNQISADLFFKKDFLFFRYSNTIYVLCCLVSLVSDVVFIYLYFFIFSIFSLIFPRARFIFLFLNVVCGTLGCFAGRLFSLLFSRWVFSIWSAIDQPIRLGAHRNWSHGSTSFPWFFTFCFLSFIFVFFVGAVGRLAATDRKTCRNDLVVGINKWYEINPPIPFFSSFFHGYNKKRKKKLSRHFNNNRKCFPVGRSKSEWWEMESRCYINRL